MTKKVTPSLELTELTHALFVLSKCLYGPAGLPSNRGDPARRLTLKEGPQKRFFNPVIGQLHDDIILLQLPESFSLLFSWAN